MQNLAHQRCFNHGLREAVARCPECKNFFCRECITEHDDRVLCSTCLKKHAEVPARKRPAFVTLKRAAQCTFGLLIAWFFFFVIGELLVRVPTSFHEGTMWEVPWLERK
jgi:hypothetical protein